MLLDAGSLPSFDTFAEYLGIGSYGISVLKIMGVDIVLAGDNAVVIAMACRALPPRQRTAGIVLGTTAAVFMRIIFTLVVGSLLGVPLLGLVGGLVLFWIALKLLLAEEPDEESVHSGDTLWDAVKTVAIADAVMSLDNVLAVAAAARGDWLLVVLGLMISIPLVVAGSTLIMAMLHRYPALVWAGAALLGWIAGELIIGEQLLHAQTHEIAELLGVHFRVLELMAGTLGALIVVGIGSLLIRRRGDYNSYESFEAQADQAQSDHEWPD
jgi:YjbE family integral membrane protein